MKPVSEDTELVLGPASTVITYEPMGVCAIFSAWNYPVITALKPLIQAIATGNAVIMKPSEIAANTSAVIKKLFDRCLDPDYFRCIEGGIDVAVKLNNQKLDLLCFTGSTQVGRIVAGVAAKNLTKCILELGGKCPAVVHSSCEMLHTVEKLCFSKFSNSGQTCIAPDYIFVHEKVVKKFIPLMIQCIKKFWGESPTGTDSQGKIINQFHIDRLTKLIDTSGGEILYGGRVNGEVKHIQPTMILNPNLESPLMNEEIFGPIMPIIVYKNITEVTTYINANGKPLAVYWYGGAMHPDSAKLFN